MNKPAFFEAMELQGVALTYDDVTLCTGPSQVSPGEVDIQSKFSTNVEVKNPLISAAMDTVTEANMAIAMAKLGGLGVVHAGLSVEDQRREVRRVKLHLNGLIENPITIQPDETLADVLTMCDRRGFDFRTFPVVDDEQRLIGILTQSAFDFSEELSRDKVHQAMTPVDQVTTGSAQLDKSDAYGLMKEHKRKMLPLIHEDGTVAGLYILSDVLRLVRGNPDQYNLDNAGRLRVAAAVPTDPEEALERVGAMEDYLDVAVIDTAQGDSKYAIETLIKLKENVRDIDIVIGNISEGVSARLLAEHGADGIKVGQGPGSICTTRVETGIGTPQVTAVYECVKAIREAGKDIPVCADGGIVSPGDISTAIAAGAHTVMMGSKLAGTKESPGEIEQLTDGKLVKFYRGMGSASALRDNPASRKRYQVTGDKPLAEGVEAYVPYVGPVSDPVSHYIKSLRKSMSYVGAPDIETHRADTRFRRITNAGVRESHPHDVQIA